MKLCLSFFACPFGLAGFALLAVLWACLAGCGFALPDQALGFALLFCGGFACLLPCCTLKTMLQSRLMGFWGALLGCSYPRCMRVHCAIVGDSVRFSKIYGGLPLVNPLDTPLEPDF